MTSVEVDFPKVTLQKEEWSPTLLRLISVELTERTKVVASYMRCDMLSCQKHSTQPWSLSTFVQWDVLHTSELVALIYQNSRQLFHFLPKLWVWFSASTTVSFNFQHIPGLIWCPCTPLTSQRWSWDLSICTWHWIICYKVQMWKLLLVFCTVTLKRAQRI